MIQKIQILVIILCLIGYSLQGIGVQFYTDTGCQNPSNLIYYYTETCQTQSNTSSMQFHCTATSVVVNSYQNSGCSGSPYDSGTLFESINTCFFSGKVFCNYYPPASEIVSSALSYVNPNCIGSIAWATYLTNACVPGTSGASSYSCANNVLTLNSYSSATSCSGTPFSSVNTNLESGCSQSSSTQQFCGFVAAASRSDVIGSVTTICFIAVVYLLVSFIH